MKYLLLTKKQLTVTAASLLAVVTVVLTATAFMSAGKKRLLPIYSVDRDDKCISLTFDAAWSADDTDDIIRILDSYEVKATFFCVGSWVDANPDAVKKLHDAGHEIMNHSDKHPHINNISKERLIEDTISCNEKIKTITGEEPTLYRGPYGEYDDKAVAAIEEMGMYYIQWSADTVDWKKENTSEMQIDNVMKRISSGGIILMHNGTDHTVETLSGLLKRLTDDGYKFLTVSELIYKDGYEIDQNGVQRKKSDGG